MTLTPAEFVRWEVDGAHHTGRVMRLPSGDLITHEGGLCVRHSFTHALEFVPLGELVICPEEHPE